MCHFSLLLYIHFSHGRFSPATCSKKTPPLLACSLFLPSLIGVYKFISKYLPSTNIETAQLTLMHLRHPNIFPLPLLLLRTHPKLLIPLLPHLLQRLSTLPLLYQTPHQLRLPQRNLIPAINLPEMIRLPVQTDNILHLLGLSLLPHPRWQTVRTRHTEHTGLDLEDVGVPEFALGGVEGLVEFGRDHILDADEFGGGFGGVVD